MLSGITIMDGHRCLALLPTCLSWSGATCYSPVFI
ncbi:hypothetical protein [Escherichia phage vB_EcoP_LHP]